MKIYKKINLIVLILFFAAFLSSSTYGLPEVDEVVSGSADFQETDSTLTVNVHTDKLITNYNSFSIAQNEAVNFIQPSSSSIALNRVTGVEPSSIFGVLTANGKIFLMNPNGVMFGPDSRVDVAGLVVSTLDISNNDFLNNRYAFYGQGGSVVNEGGIFAPGGYVALLGSTIENPGIIEANLGSIALASGEKVTLNLDPQGLISVVVNEDTTQNLEQKNDAVKNTGTITANGGMVILTVRTLNDIFDKAINNEGIIEANAIDGSEGQIDLIANQNVNVSGEINAEGGTVSVDSQGADISATINAESGTFNMNDGDTFLDQTYITGPGDWTFTDNVNITVIGDLTVTGGTLKLLAGNNLTVNDLISVSSGDVRLYADNDDNEIGSLVLGKDVTVTTGGDFGHYLKGANDFKFTLYLGKLFGGNYLYLKSTKGKLEADQDLSKSEGIDLYAAGDLKVKNSISSDKNIRLYADIDNNQSGNLIFETNGIVTVGENFGHYLEGSNIFTLDAAFLSKLAGGNYIYVKSTKNNINITEDLSKSAGIEIYTPADLTVDSDISASLGNITLTADHLTLTAENGIGTSSNPFYTHVNILNASTTTGGIYINETDSVSLNLIDANDSDVNLTAGTSILDNDLGVAPTDYDIIADNITLNVGTGTIGQAGESNEIDLQYTGTLTENVNPTTPTDLASSSHTAGTWSNDNTVTLSWTAATDPNYYTGSGISGYYYEWSTEEGTVPDGTYETSSAEITGSALDDGNSWYFHVRSVDNSNPRNISTTTEHIGPFFIDTIVSSSQEAIDALVIGDIAPSVETTGVSSFNPAPTVYFYHPVSAGTPTIDTSAIDTSIVDGSATDTSLTDTSVTEDITLDEGALDEGAPDSIDAEDTTSDEGASDEGTSEPSDGEESSDE